LTCDIHHLPTCITCPLDLVLAKRADRKSLVAKVQSVAGLGTLVFRVGSSVSGTRKLANGTSVTIGNWAKTPVFGQVTLACGYRIDALADVNKVFARYVSE